MAVGMVNDLLPVTPMLMVCSISSQCARGACAAGERPSAEAGQRRRQAEVQREGGKEQVGSKVWRRKVKKGGRVGRQ